MNQTAVLLARHLLRPEPAPEPSIVRAFRRALERGCYGRTLDLPPSPWWGEL